MRPTPEAPKTAGYVLSGLRAKYYDAHNALFGVPLIIRKHLHHIDLQPGDSLLDLGCGTGEVIRQLHRRLGGEARLQGIDPSPDMLAVARRKLQDCGSASVEWGVGERLSYAADTFHWVVSCLTMHHLPLHAKRQALGECYRVLKPRGRLLISDFGKPEGAIGRGFARIWRDHAFTAENLEHVLYGLIPEAGFSIMSSAIQGGVIHHILAAKA